MSVIDDAKRRNTLEEDIRALKRMLREKEAELRLLRAQDCQHENGELTHGSHGSNFWCPDCGYEEKG